MAKQRGIIKLKGTIGGVTFYRSQDGDLAREKGGVDKDRIQKDAAFVRTRENGLEFGNSASAGKLLRTALRSMMMSAADNRVTARLTKVMTDIKNFDAVSKRGKRNVGDGIAAVEAKALLKGFDFNIKALMGTILFKPINVNTGTGVITLNDLSPVNDIRFAEGATHVTLRAAWAKIDFETGKFDVQPSNSVTLPIDSNLSDVVLTPAAVPAGAGVGFYVLLIEFHQEVNGEKYSLKNGSFNALSIVEVL